MTNRLNTFWHENFFLLMSLWKSDWKFPSMEMSLIAEYFLEILDLYYSTHKRNTIFHLYLIEKKYSYDKDYVCSNKEVRCSDFFNKNFHVFMV